MRIIVCAKQIPDPETPPSAFKIDAASNKVAPAPGVAQVLSQFDAIAAEAALRIKIRRRAANAVTSTSLRSGIVSIASSTMTSSWRPT